MNKIGNGVQVYLVDIVVHAKTKIEHDAILQQAFQQLEANNLLVSEKTIRFCLPLIKLMEFQLMEKELGSDQSLKKEFYFLSTLQHTQAPMFPVEMNVYRNFIPDLAAQLALYARKLGLTVDLIRAMIWKELLKH